MDTGVVWAGLHAVTKGLEMASSKQQIDNGRSLVSQSQTLVQVAAAMGVEQGEALSYTQGGHNIVAGDVVETVASLNAGAVETVDWSKAQGFAAPRGHVTPPTLPASAATFTNKSNRDALVTVTGGTVTVIAVAGTATGRTSGTVPVSSGQTIAVTYSAAPTWSWVLL